MQKLIGTRLVRTVDFAAIQFVSYKQEKQAKQGRKTSDRSAQSIAVLMNRKHVKVIDLSQREVCGRREIDTRLLLCNQLIAVNSS